MKKIFFPVFLCAALCGLYAGPKETALEKEKNGDLAGAVSAYEEWLKANPASPDFAATLFHAADIHPDLKQSIRLLETCQALSPEKAVRSAIMGKTATLYEISGDFPRAQRLFEQAYHADPGEESFSFLYRAARLLFELGETQKSEDLARLIAGQCKTPLTKKRAAFLLVRIAAASGNAESALALAIRLTGDSAGPADNESIYLFIFTLADSLGRQAERTLALQGLAKNYPDSPEFRIASRAAGGSGAAGVSPLPTPSALLGPFAAPKASSPEPPAPAPQPAPAGIPPAPAPQPAPRQDAAPAPTAVQTGSFSVKENAQYMARDLVAHGFAAEVLTARGKTGESIYKVIIPIRPGEDPQRLLILLKEKSIEGFLLF
ncbi:MAG: tetratricopeptide repeat protein [Spirochaetia bacterium]|nr:tetratricopeptide repeat protein [Spirochaetia bacterium]